MGKQETVLEPLQLKYPESRIPENIHFQEEYQEVPYFVPLNITEDNVEEKMAKLTNSIIKLLLHHKMPQQYTIFSGCWSNLIKRSQYWQVKGNTNEEEFITSRVLRSAKI